MCENHLGLVFGGSGCKEHAVDAGVHHSYTSYALINAVAGHLPLCNGRYAGCSGSETISPSETSVRFLKVLLPLIGVHERNVFASLSLLHLYAAYWVITLLGDVADIVRARTVS